MRASALSVALVVMFGCNQTPTGAIKSPSPMPSASPTSSAVPCPSASTYGLLIAASKLEMIGPTGCIRASAGVNAPSVRTCADGLPALLAPPVSASNTRVYFRDGDTRIRSLKDDQEIADVTTVPGSTTTLSFFSVSPDDQRIAVVVEDMAPAETIGLRVYVEDLVGGGHHADIYASTIPKGGGLTLWPMGWHQGAIVMAVVLGCSVVPIASPSEWHVVNAMTAIRVATLPGSATRCMAGFWQSPVGVACSIDNTTFVNDWAGKLLTQDSYAIPPEQAQLSPSGASAAIDYNGGDGWGGQGPHTDGIMFGHRGLIILPGHESCLWIDDGSLLAPDAVIAYPSGTVAALPAVGQCAGRFPGGL